MKSPEIGEIAKALAKFQACCPPIQMDSSVTVTTDKSKYSFKYASMETIVATARPCLKEAGLSFTQLLESDGTVITLLLHESGQWLESRLKIGSNAARPQEVGSAISYAKRYALSALLGIVAEEDDDANIASGNHVQKGTDAKKAAPKADVPPMLDLEALVLKVHTVAQAEEARTTLKAQPLTDDNRKKWFKYLVQTCDKRGIGYNADSQKFYDLSAQAEPA